MEMVQYTVRPGNTLFGIAQFFQTTVNDILKYNNIQTPDAIFVGQVLTVPPVVRKRSIMLPVRAIRCG